MKLTWTTAVTFIDWHAEREKRIRRVYPTKEAPMQYDTDKIKDFIAQWRNPIIFGVVVAVVIVMLITGG